MSRALALLTFIARNEMTKKQRQKVAAWLRLFVSRTKSLSVIGGIVLLHVFGLLVTLTLWGAVLTLIYRVNA